VASFLVAAAEGHERADWFRSLKAQGHDHLAQAPYVQSERHLLEANYYAYRRQARRLLRRFGEMGKAELKSWRKSKAAGRTGSAGARAKALSMTSS
jgi:CelD/BcsL family acetyltransferase involved in cellulose biosynthesis